MKLLFISCVCIFFAPVQSFLPGLLPTSRMGATIRHVTRRQPACGLRIRMTNQDPESDEDGPGPAQFFKPRDFSKPQDMRSIIVSPEKMVAPGEKRYEDTSIQSILVYASLRPGPAKHDGSIPCSLLSSCCGFAS
jgi:hypothetical protein